MLGWFWCSSCLLACTWLIFMIFVHFTSFHCLCRAERETLAGVLSDPSQWWDHRSKKVNRYSCCWWNYGSCGRQNISFVYLTVASFAWNTKIKKYVKAGQPEKCNKKGCVLTISPLFRCLMHVLAYEHLRRAGWLVNKSFKVIWVKCLCGE
jgi:hypothetical protein